MFERFTDRARRVIVLAQEESRMLRHNYIGTEHILLGILHEGESLAAQALHARAFSLDGVRARVEDMVGRGESSPPGHIPYTPRAKKVLELALREALHLGDNYIAPEHILLGLVREGQGLAAQLLGDLTLVRETVTSFLSPARPAEPDPDPSDPSDPTEGAIHRVLTNPRLRGYQDIQHALNEAYRNGQRAATSAEPPAEPPTVRVHVPGVPYESEDGQSRACDWVASLVKDVDPHRNAPSYALPPHFWDVATRSVLVEHACAFPAEGTTGWVEIPGLRAPDRMEGDPHDKIHLWQATNFGPRNGPVQLRVDDPRGNPNDVAVGRFKASFRKFLGID